MEVDGKLPVEAILAERKRAIGLAEASAVGAEAVRRAEAILEKIVTLHAAGQPAAGAKQ